MYIDKLESREEIVMLIRKKELYEEVHRQTGWELVPRKRFSIWDILDSKPLFLSTVFGVALIVVSVLDGLIN